MNAPQPPLDGTALLRLLHLASPALPIGAFAYSNGLEAAVEAGHVVDEASAGAWIFGIVEHGLTTLDLPLFARMHAAWAADDEAAVRKASDRLFASRGSSELQTEDRRLGSALARALGTLGLGKAAAWENDPRATQLALFALAAARFEIPLVAAAQGFLFSWCEAQVAAALRLVPLGQSSGLRLLARAVEVIPAAVARGLALPDDEIGAATPGQALLSARHETQYSRLFRS